MTAKTIFISYSLNDKELAAKVMVHFIRYADSKEVDVFAWDDETRKKDKEKKRRNIDQANIAILIITADYLASKEIQEFEFKILYERWLKKEVIIIPIIGKPCDWLRVPWLRSQQVYPGNNLSLIELSDLDQILELSSLANKIHGFLMQDSEQDYFIPPQFDQDHHVEGQNNLVFISHCLEDIDFADNIKNRLERNNYQAWTYNDMLHAGENWRDEIDVAIRNSFCVIVIMSPNARNSEYVTYEWAFALGANRPLIPVLRIQTQLHPRLEALQYLDFTNYNGRPWNTLFNRLDEI